MDRPMLRVLLHGLVSSNESDLPPGLQFDSDPSLQNNNNLKWLLNDLVLDKIMQRRITQIAFGCISASLALFIIYRIWADSWRASKLQVNLRPKKFAFLYRIHPAESFPLILGICIFFQQILFIGVQASSLNSIMISNCRDTAQFIFPAIFILGYLNLVFGLEMTIRGLRGIPFAKRHRWTNRICLLTVTLMLVATFVIARTVMPSDGMCFGNLIFRASALGLNRTVIGLLSVTIASFMAMATIIGLQLLRTVQIDPNERIAGSRMVYYLVATAITYALVLPFFVQLFYMMMDSELTSSRVAEFALFASGTVIAVIHIFLRANAARLAIKPRETPWQARRRFRLFGPSELEIMNISPPLNLINPNYGSDEKIADLYARQQRPALKVQSPQTPLPNFSFPAKSFDNGSKSPWPLPQQRLPSPKEARGPSSLPRMGADHNRRQPSYTLWPGADDIKLPLAVYSPPGPSNAPLPLRSVLQLDTGGTLTSQKYQPPSASTKANSSPGSPPAPGRLVPPALPWAPSHRRGSSASSSATVQIGIRFSTAPSALGAANRRSSLQIPPLAPRKDSIKFDPALLNSKALPPLVGHASPLSTPQPVTDVTGRDLDAFTWADSPNDDIERQSNSSEPLFELVTRAINRRSSLAETMKSVYSQSSVVGLPDRKGWI